MEAKITDINGLMKKYEFTDFQQNLLHGILEYLSNTTVMSSTDDIIVEYCNLDKDITIIYVGVIESYQISMRPGNIWVDYRLRNKSWENGDRIPVYDTDQWKLSTFPDELQYQRSFFQVYRGVTEKRNVYLENARALLSYALNHLNIEDSCDWLK